MIDEYEWLVWLEVHWWIRLVSVDDIPLLVQSVVQGVYTNILVVSIAATVYIKNLSFLVDNITIPVVEKLPPPGIGPFKVKVGVSTSVWNAHR